MNFNERAAADAKAEARDAEIARIAHDTRDMEIQGLVEIIDTLSLQVSQMQASPNRTTVRKILAQMLVAKTALQQIPDLAAQHLADVVVDSHR